MSPRIGNLSDAPHAFGTNSPAPPPPLFSSFVAFIHSSFGSISLPFFPTSRPDPTDPTDWTPYKTHTHEKKQQQQQIKEKYPNVPTVAYIKHSGALVERMAATGVDVVSLDWTVDMAEGRERIASGRAKAGLSGPGGVQGNLDPAVLFGDFATIKERAEEILKKAGPVGHVMNLGHGIEAATPEENAAYFIETVKNYRHES